MRGCGGGLGRWGRELVMDRRGAFDRMRGRARNGGRAADHADVTFSRQLQYLTP